MIKYLTLFFLFTFFIKNALPEIINSDDFVTRDELVYKKFSNTPFTGTIQTLNEQGNVIISEDYKNGLLHGNYIFYFDEGQLMRRVSYKKGIRDGEIVTYRLNGTVNEKGLYKKGKRTGPFIRFTKVEKSCKK